LKKLSELMHGRENRHARFVTVISLRLDGQHVLFEGICPGIIAAVPSGAEGFGYDPLFIPTGSDRSFASMSMEEKNKFSHRKKAVAKMAAFLRQNKLA